MFFFDAFNVWNPKIPTELVKWIEKKQCLDLNDPNSSTPKSTVKIGPQKLRCFASSESGTFFLSHLQSPGSVRKSRGTSVLAWNKKGSRVVKNLLWLVEASVFSTWWHWPCRSLPWFAGQTTHHCHSEVDIDGMMDCVSPFSVSQSASSSSDQLHPLQNLQVTFWSKCRIGGWRRSLQTL